MTIFKNNGKLKLLIIVGTRPEIIRLAAVINKCRKYFDVVLAHTGQNYDYNLNGIFFKDLKLADPEVYLDTVGDDLGATMGNIIDKSYKLSWRRWASPSSARAPLATTTTVWQISSTKQSSGATCWCLPAGSAPRRTT